MGGEGICDTGVAGDSQLTATFIATGNTPNTCSPVGAIDNGIESSQGPRRPGR